MGEYGVAKSRVRQIAHHGELKHAHDLAAFQAEHGAAEDRRVSRSTTTFMSPRDSATSTARATCDIGIVATAMLRRWARASRSVSPIAAQLWIDEDRVRHQAAGDGGRPAIQQIRAQDAEVVVGNVRERGTALHVADRVDAGRRRGQPFVDGDMAAVVDGDTGRGRQCSVSVFGTRPVASRTWLASMRRTVPPSRIQPHSVRRLRDRVGIGVEQDVDAIIAENGCDGIGDVCVFVTEQLWTAVHDRDAASESPEHLRELDADVAAADDEEVRGKGVQFHDGRRVQRRHPVEAVISEGEPDGRRY